VQRPDYRGAEQLRSGLAGFQARAVNVRDVRSDLAQGATRVQFSGHVNEFNAIDDIMSGRTV